MMTKTISKFLILFTLITLSPNVSLGQSFSELSHQEQEKFFEGYWKYSSPNNDTIFIIMLKQLRKTSGHNVYVGTYLYYCGNTLIENNLYLLSDYLSIINYADYKKLYFSREKEQEYHPFYFSNWEYDKIVGSFYDYTQQHWEGQPTLSVISSKRGEEKICWNLDWREGVILYETEEEQERISKFSVPQKLTLQKMYNLSEFEDKGIILEPFSNTLILEDEPEE